MNRSFEIRIVLRLADCIGARARKLRRDQRDHVRSESFRIQQAEKRACGLRLYAAWSGSQRSSPTHELSIAWHPAESVT